MTDTTETMLKRAARALAPKAWAAMETGDSIAQTNRRIASLRHVRAVLRAIREPDERVLEATAAALVRPTLMMGGSSPLAKRQALAVWQAGIDAIEQGRTP